MLSNKEKQKDSQHYFDLKANAGFTLIELIISIAVFTIGIMATLGLALSNYNNSHDNLDKIIATNLAREGIELIRNVRDTNWLKIDANDGACGGVCAWDDDLNSSDYFFIDYNVTALTACAAYNCAGSELYKSTEGYYTHEDLIADTTNILTRYSRVMKLERICLNETTFAETQVPMTSTCVGDAYIGIQVTSHVQWEDGSTQSVEVVDRLYNWRR